MNWIIRPILPEDFTQLELLVRDAFWNLYKPGCDEHYLVHRFPNHPDFLPNLSYVAIIENQIVGVIFYTISHLQNDNQKIPCVTFGPFCVHPHYQHQGIGRALIQKTTSLAQQEGSPAVVILGDPHNYCQHGFKNGLDYGVCYTDGSQPLGLLVLPLKEGFFNHSKWTYHGSSVYDLEGIDIDSFDQQFPTKEKNIQPSQEVFSILIRSQISHQNLLN